MEYIDKAELLRKLKKLATEAWMSNLKAKVETTINACIDVIDNEPTIDIVHCGECIHFRKGWTKCKMLNLNGADSDWFCADGARKSVKEVSNKPTLKHADKETLQSAT